MAKKKDARSAIDKIGEEFFTKQVFDWMRQQEVSQSLQAKLRMELFDQFSATRLGKFTQLR